MSTKSARNIWILIAMAAGTAGPAPGCSSGQEEAPPTREAAAATVPDADPSPSLALSEPPPASSPKARLSGGASSEREIAGMVLQALEDRNEDALHALRITEDEYKDHVFPEFAEAKGTIPAGFHWFHLDVRSHAGVQKSLARFGGVHLELLDVLPTRGITEYATYHLFNRVELVVRFPDGREEQVRIFGSLVHMDGVWKILSFPS